MFNYHELTMTESRDSPARRKQFLVICVGGFSILLWAMLCAGTISPVEIQEGVFPGGGEFVFKPMAKDYASSMGLARAVCKDLDIPETKWEDVVYALYLDDSNVAGPDNRYMVGAFIGDDSTDDTKKKETLLALNDHLPPVKKGEEFGGGRFLNHKSLPYEVGRFPSNVRAVVTHFPYTNGFISLLVHNFKVFPAIWKHVREVLAKEEKGGGSNNAGGGVEYYPIVTTCSVDQQMCTHYAPLEKQDQFMMGRPDTRTYVKELKALEAVNNSDGMSAKNIVRGLQKLFAGSGEEL